MANNEHNQFDDSDDETEQDEVCPSVVFKLAGQLYAISSQDIREMVSLSAIHSLPDSPSYVRGVMNLRGDVIPVIDMRLRLGMTSALQEVEDFVALMEQREQDHRRWVGELEACVNENREFKLTRDPHACAFGKWYDSYKTNYVQLSALLKKFDAPHKSIHASADRIFGVLEREGVEKARAEIHALLRGPFAEMIALFGQLKAHIRDSFRDIAIVLGDAGSLFAVTVDAIEGVEHLEALLDHVPEAHASAVSSAVKGIAQRVSDSAVVLMLDTQFLKSV